MAQSVNRIVTFGEIMVRMAPPGVQRIQQSLPGKLDVTFAGAEANVAASLAMLGKEAEFVTALPEGPLTDACLGSLRSVGIGTRHTRICDQGRFGIFFVETGANQRPTRVFYDRDYSSISLSGPGTAIDLGMYPLGSCTMKYNPKVNERAARMPACSGLHPAQPEETLEGALALMWGLERALCEITGFQRATLQPAAGAHGELTGLMMIRTYHQDHGGKARKKIIIPDSAHGTNPASCTLNGFEALGIKTGAGGVIEVEAVRAACAAHPGAIAGIMLTNPSTLGLFETKIAEITEVVHAAGGLCYMEGGGSRMLRIARQTGAWVEQENFFNC